MKKLATGLGLIALLAMNGNAQQRYPAPPLYTHLGDSLIKLMYEAELTQAVKDNINRYDTLITYFCKLSKAFFQPNEVVFTHYVNPEIPTYFVKGLISQESQGDKIAESKKEAKGLMQILPLTAVATLFDYGAADWLNNHPNTRYVNAKKINTFTENDLYDPTTNLFIGIYYLTGLWLEFNQNFNETAAAWNANLETSAKYNGMPPIAQTLFFVGRVNTFTEKWKEIEQK